MLPFKLAPDAPRLCSNVHAMEPMQRRGNRRLRVKRWVRLLRRRALRAVRANGNWPRRRMPARLRAAWRTGKLPVVLCAASGCRYHLAELAHNPLESTACALMVASRGGLSQGKLGDLIGVARQRIHELETEALHRRDLEALADAHQHKDHRTATERVEAAVRRGPGNAIEIARGARCTPETARSVLNALTKKGICIADAGTLATGRVWSVAP